MRYPPFGAALLKIQVGIELQPLDSTDMEIARKWRNSYTIWAWTRQNDLISDVEQAAWFERQSKDPTIRMYMVVVQTDGHDKPVGVCGLTSIDWMNRRAEFSLYIAPAFQRRGFGKKALGLLLDHGFTNLGLRQIWGETFETNPAMKVFIELGMTKDGTRRQFYWKDGRWLDAHLVSILADEWRSRRDTERNHDAVPSPSSGRSLPRDIMESARDESSDETPAASADIVLLDDEGVPAGADYAFGLKHARAARKASEKGSGDQRPEGLGDGEKGA
jgi:ribosomal-protein-alanine N-acetyltransferase